MNLRQAIANAAAKLSSDPHLRDTATRDAELLVMHHTGLTRARLLAHPERELTEEEEFFFQQSIHRRAEHEPIQYITGHQEFYGLDFQVSPAVLIPRPETEHLVEAVLERLPQNQPLRILDVGTGSGILAVTLAHHLPHAEFTAVDISREALAIARRNAEIHHVADHILFVESNLLANAPRGPYDAIVSNPPYIPASDLSTLHPQVREHEPHTALFAGPSGLDIYRRLIPQARTALTPGGLLAMEIGYGQQSAITDLLADWHQVSFINDLQGIPRGALARSSSDDPK